MRKYILLCFNGILLTACVEAVSTPDPSWYEILPGENECAIAYQVWASIPPVGYEPIEGGWIIRTNEGIGEKVVATYGEHNCDSAISYYTEEWNKSENERLMETQNYAGGFIWRKNIDMKCVCDTGIIKQAKKEMEPILNKQEDENEKI